MPNLAHPPIPGVSPRLPGVMPASPQALFCQHATVMHACMQPDVVYWPLMALDGCAAAGLVNWRLWVLSLCWFLVEASIYGILFWAPLLLDAIFVGTLSLAALVLTVVPCQQPNMGT